MDLGYGLNGKWWFGEVGSRKGGGRDRGDRSTGGDWLGVF